MKSLSVLLAAVLSGFAAVASTADGPVSVSRLLDSPGDFHGVSLKVAGVFFTDGEGATLLEAFVTGLDDFLKSDRRVRAEFADDIVRDATYQAFVEDRKKHIRKVKAENPKVGWVVYQTRVVVQGVFVSAESLPHEEGDYYLANPYGGLPSKIDVERILSFEPIAEDGDQALQPTL